MLRSPFTPLNFTEDEKIMFSSALQGSQNSDGRTSGQPMSQLEYMQTITPKYGIVTGSNSPVIQD